MTRWTQFKKLALQVARKTGKQWLSLRDLLDAMPRLHPLRPCLVRRDNFIVMVFRHIVDREIEFRRSAKGGLQFRILK